MLEERNNGPRVCQNFWPDVGAYRNESFGFLRFKLVIQNFQYVLAKRGEYASAYGAELRSVFLRLPQYDRLASLGQNTS